MRFGEDVAGPEDQVTVLRKKKARFRTVLVIGSEFADTEEKKMPEKKSQRWAWLRAQETGLAIPLVLLICIIGLVNPLFFDPQNIIDVLRNTSFMFIVAAAMTFVLIAAGLDLSVGSVIAFGGIVGSMVLAAGAPIFLGILAGVLTGAGIGFINGFVVVKFGIPPLIVTLGMMYAGQGAVLVVTRGTPVYPLPAAFNAIGQGNLAGIPYVVLIAAVVGIVAHIVLTRTTYGRMVFATGGNAETSRLSGINVNFVNLTVYILTGMAAAFVGMLMASRLASAQPGAGAGWELQVIAAVIIGGTSMFGGSGSILGSLLGVLFMNVVSTGMIMMRISAYWQNLVVGVIIVVAVGIDQYRRRKVA
ncbi:Branched-chain amino acid transport system / permease component [Acididesulfobacillus acetoxydans]|uniref:Branched-chain amino acid transport system / permease component n=1 Tax=Acididesulfobacillus acetoxydans TaxID=1561005 RepID=A0A8S0W7Q4_9FIRM|nr:Branched-chain amino acid transport system / permease component [Acididesulfobacillus acetoxydans]CEJ06893.1 Ribose transport system permease protein RbsC [Acididesulfobacillus acetoxydans]